MPADLYSYRPLRPDQTIEERRALLREMVDAEIADGAVHCRATIFSDEHPSDTYPHGLYVEGWRERPSSVPPPAFEFPLSMLPEG